MVVKILQTMFLLSSNCALKPILILIVTFEIQFYIQSTIHTAITLFKIIFNKVTTLVFRTCT